MRLMTLNMFTASQIVALHDQSTERWHQDPGWLGPEDQTAWLRLVLFQHRANFDLWHVEDEARTPEATDAQIAGVKRRVDETNQRRNDLAEELDRTLLERLATPLRVAGADRRSAVDIGAEDLPHAAGDSAHGSAGRPRRAQYRAPGCSRRTTGGSGGLPRCVMATDAGWGQAL